MDTSILLAHHKAWLCDSERQAAILCRRVQESGLSSNTTPTEVEYK